MTRSITWSSVVWLRTRGFRGAEVKKYSYAALSVAAATAARLVLDRAVGYHHPYATFYVAVLLSSWYGGIGPGLLATALGGIAAVLVVGLHALAAASGVGALVGFEFYFIVSLTGAILFEAQRRAERKSALNADIARKRLDQLEKEIAQRRQAEEAAHELQEQFRLTFEHAPVGIGQLTLEGSLIEVNPRLCEITGYSRRELLASNFFGLLCPSDDGGSGERYFALQQGSQAAYKEERWLSRKNGGLFWAELAISIVHDTAGAVRYGVAVLQDATARKRAEEELREAQKQESVGVLAGGIAHDFNNLLTGVLGNASLALDALPRNSGAHGMLEAVVSAAKRAAYLTSQLLAYAGKGAFAVDEVDLSRVVSSSRELVSLSLPSNSEVRFQLDDDLPTIRADSRQIQQILANLVINAGEAIPEGSAGVITVGTGLMRFGAGETLPTAVGQIESGSYLALRVEDTGEGIEAGAIPKIFDPFFTTKFMGRGLGLAAVAGIVRALKGAILVSSRPNRGTTFSVLFPVQEGETRAAEAGNATHEHVSTLPGEW
jgi:PAS domain S-box-containing protein